MRGEFILLFHTVLYAFVRRSRASSREGSLSCHNWLGMRIWFCRLIWIYLSCTTSKGYRGPIVTQITTSNETMSENNDQLSGERKWLSYQDNGSGVNLWNVCLRNELGAIGQNFTAMDTKIAASHYDIMGILDVIKGASVKSTVMRVGQNLVVVGGSLSQNQWF